MSLLEHLALKASRAYIQEESWRAVENSDCALKEYIQNFTWSKLQCRESNLKPDLDPLIDLGKSPRQAEDNLESPWQHLHWCDKPRQHIKKQRHHFADKGPDSQSYGFSSSHVWTTESWTIKKAEYQTIDAFKLSCWRRLLRVPWTARLSNQSILKEINPEYSLEGLILKLQYFGHLMQRTDSLEKTLMLGKIEGRRRRGQQRMRRLGGIINSMHMSLSKLQEIVKVRGAWGAAVHEVTESQAWLSDWMTTRAHWQQSFWGARSTMRTQCWQALLWSPSYSPVGWRVYLPTSKMAPVLGTTGIHSQPHGDPAPPTSRFSSVAQSCLTLFDQPNYSKLLKRKECFWTHSKKSASLPYKNQTEIPPKKREREREKKITDQYHWWTGQESAFNTGDCQCRRWGFNP